MPKPATWLATVFMRDGFEDFAPAPKDREALLYTLALHAPENGALLHGLCFVGPHFRVVFTTPTEAAARAFAADVSRDLAGYLHARYGLGEPLAVDPLGDDASLFDAPLLDRLDAVSEQNEALAFMAALEELQAQEAEQALTSPRRGRASAK